MLPRTDLAMEAKELFERSAGEQTRLSGVLARETDRRGVRMTLVRILDAEGEQALGKPRGTYITAELDALARREPGSFAAAARTIGRALRELLGPCRQALVVGLGNPGSKYEGTRHNMGFLTVDLLAEQAGVKLNKVKFKSAYNIIPFAGSKCLVMKPQTYMNLSGEAVREAVQFYKIPADHVLVIYDDVSLPVGKLRVRPTGSAGGHNGIKNIIAHLGTQDFPRIKIGTGAPGEGGDMIDWVIGVPSQAESFRRAIDAAECIIEHGCQKAMNDFN